MTYREEEGNLFEVGDEYNLVQCISADFGMGKGIAVDFNKKFDVKNKIVAKYKSYVPTWDILFDNDTIKRCIKVDKVYNVITKRNYWHKPTYEDFTAGIKDLKEMCVQDGVTHLAMPKIGSGLDRLKWSICRSIIKKAFVDTEIDILVKIK